MASALASINESQLEALVRPVYAPKDGMHGVAYVRRIVREARALARGYARVLPVPELARVRPVYLYLYRLIEIQSATPIDEWLAWPAWFDEAGPA